jgi:hypothetical protein
MTRFLLVLACLAFIGLVLLGMRLGWRNRHRRQAALPALPTLPDELGPLVLSAATGVYVGTTFAASWQDRVVHAGLGMPAAATVRLHRAGVLFERDGADDLLVPAASVVQARLAPGLAGSVVGEGGLLVIRWRLGDVELDTGFRADDKRMYPDWVRTINSEVAAR